MGNVCRGGMFDGMPVYTREDARTCVEGGGTVTGDGGGDICPTSSAASFGPEPHAQDLSSLGRALALYGQSDEVGLLDRLSQAAVPVVVAIMARDDELAREAQEGLARLTRLAARATDLDADGPLYSAEDHAAFVALAEKVASVSESDEVRDLAQQASAVAERFIDVPASTVRERMGPLPDFARLEPASTVRPFVVASPPAVSLSHLLGAHFTLMTAASEASEHVLSPLGLLVDYENAKAAIEAKAASLGPLGEGTPDDLRQLADGWVRSYPACDIYVSQATGAHEVHGDIRRKYDAVNGPGWLGLPTSDETGTPDGRGRFNHFARDASIYWTPSTGPMIVRGAIRKFWADAGWERGSWGYPVADEQRIPGLYPPGDAPNLAWSAFQNGMGFSQGAGCLPAVFASATREEILGAVRSMFDRKLKPVSVEVGLISVTVRPGLGSVEFLGVEDWTRGFWAAVPRTLGLRLNGFVSTPIVGDPTFQIDLWLRFVTVWPTGSFQYPKTKTVVGTLARYHVDVDGVAADTIADAIEDNLKSAFAFDPSRPEIPDWSIALADVDTGASQRGRGAIDFLDVMLAADGSLQVLVNPIPPSIGEFRRNFAQSALDAALEQISPVTRAGRAAAPGAPAPARRAARRARSGSRGSPARVWSSPPGRAWPSSWMSSSVMASRLSQNPCGCLTADRCSTASVPHAARKCQPRSSVMTTRSGRPSSSLPAFR